MDYAEQYGLSESAAKQLEHYLTLVERYSPALNLTAFRGRADLARELAGESLRLLELGKIAGGWNCVDLGSGVGTPVIPLAIATGGVDTRVRHQTQTGVSAPPHFTAVESRARRCDFLRMVVGQVHIDNLRVLETRAEQLIASEADGFDLVTARAYAAPDVLCAHASALLRDGGELRGCSGAEMSDVEQAAKSHDFAVEQVIAYTIGESRRHVYRLRKTRTRLREALKHADRDYAQQLAEEWLEGELPWPEY